VILRVPSVILRVPSGAGRAVCRPRRWPSSTRTLVHRRSSTP